LDYFLFKASKRLASASKSFGSSAGGVVFFKREFVGISGKSIESSSNKLLACNGGKA
jgi:hypothetical protein